MFIFLTFINFCGNETRLDKRISFIYRIRFITKMIHSGISIQQADVDLRPELRPGLGLATDDGTYMRLMNAHDAIFYLMALLPVHCLLLFQQMPDNEKIFQLPPVERNRLILYGVQHLIDGPYIPFQVVDLLAYRFS